MWKVSQEISGKGVDESWDMVSGLPGISVDVSLVLHTTDSLFLSLVVAIVLGMWWVRSSPLSRWKWFFLALVVLLFSADARTRFRGVGNMQLGGWYGDCGCTLQLALKILLGSRVPAWYPGCGAMAQCSLCLNVGIHCRQVLSLQFEFLILGALNTLSFTGTSWSIAPSKVLTIWNTVQYQNQRNNHLIFKVRDYECEWVGSWRDRQLGR